MENQTHICLFCNGTGIVKYKELDEFAFRQWTPWLSKPCPSGCSVAKVATIVAY